MDNRSEPRLAADREIAITILGKPPSRHPALVKNRSGSGLGLLVAVEIPPGTALRIELGDDLVLGEVMYCRPMESGWFVGVQLEQMLRGLAELRNRFAEFYDHFEEPARETR